MGKVVPARIDGIVAREAPVAVIFRRGPSSHTQLLTWNLETDEITPGQWITSKVYPRKSDLSPDGKLLVASFLNCSSRRDECFGSELEFDAWTSVSRPPYFNPIAAWHGFSVWYGGGLWHSSQELRRNAIDEDVAVPAPSWLRVTQTAIGVGQELVFAHRLHESGWKILQPANWEEIRVEGRREQEEVKFAQAPFIIAEKRFERGTLRWIAQTKERWVLLDLEGKVNRSFNPPESEPQFLDIDHRGRVVFGDQGCLWAWEGFPDGKPTLIADLNANRFEAIEAPAWAVSLHPS